MTGQPSASGTLGGLGGPAQILLVTDQPVLADLIKLTLNHGAFFVRAMATLAAAATQLERADPHLVLLDMDVEGIGAEGVMERIGYQGREGHKARGPSRVPVIALTRRGDLKTKLAAFDRGVDDILTVPFSPEELLARAMAVVRRSYREAVAFAPVVKVGDLEIDIYNRRVHAGGVTLQLTPLEQNLLYLLAANAGRALSRDQILDHLWGSDYVADSNVVDRHIRNLRAKLHDSWRRPRYVQTVPGKGYRFMPGTTEVKPP
jgi:DNA-binding response OmpR family regulator